MATRARPGLTPGRSPRRSALADDVALAALDALPLGVYVVDHELRVVAWNARREEGPQGRPRAQVLGRALRRALSPRGFRATRPLLERVLRSGQPFEDTHETEGGRTFRVCRLPLKRAGRVTHVVSCFEDITERRALEMRLIASDRLALLGQLVAGVAHEVSNPLAAVAGCAAVLAEAAQKAPDAAGRREAAEFYELLRGEIARCERVVRSLLDASRPATGEACDVALTVATVLRLLERHPAFARVRVQTRLPAGLPPVRLDADALKQVVLALAVNAAQAMPGGGRLMLRARRLTGALALDVSDTGPGVPAALRPRLFEPFVQGPSKGSAGLGLAIARSLVRARGGDLSLRPARGRGASFRVRLPLAEAQP
jgi:signal transduction histidine kinase